MSCLVLGPSSQPRDAGFTVHVPLSGRRNSIIAVSIKIVLWSARSRGIATEFQNAGRMYQSDGSRASSSAQ